MRPTPYQIGNWHGARGEALLDRYQAGNYLNCWPVVAGVAVTVLAWLILF